LYYFYSSPNIIRIIEPRRMESAGRVARVGRRGIHIGYWWRSLKERDHYVDIRLWIDGWILEIYDEVALTGLI
jgi:hypothetical protein